ncbi:phytochelatin synthase family protein [Neogemmobacter tilapiae]|nr:phytochelatin synthase family protein [Gemmobacter tilapiae]
MKAALALIFLLPFAALAETPVPKLGPDAVPITADNAFLRQSPAPDYWAFSPFVKPQFTTSACSVASVTAALNGLAGLPALSADAVMTQPAMLERAASREWAALSAEGGAGVKFQQLVDFTSLALAARGMGQKVTPFKPTGETDLAALRALLTANEVSAQDALLLYFNQGVVTGDWDGPHVSLIGAYDAEQDRVLVLEVDQEWYVPYWTPVPVLLAAMLKPTSAEHGVLQGETGGLVHIHP